MLSTPLDSLTLQSTIPPFFHPPTLLFILASSGFTPFFDPPTAVKEQQRMQDVGSDSGDTFGYLRIPLDTLILTLCCGHSLRRGILGGTFVPPDTRLIRTACYGYLKDKTSSEYWAGFTTDDLPVPGMRDKSSDLSRHYLKWKTSFCKLPLCIIHLNLRYKFF